MSLNKKCMYVWYACMYVWMDGWMDGRTDGWMDGWTDVTLIFQSSFNIIEASYKGIMNTTKNLSKQKSIRSISLN